MRAGDFIVIHEGKRRFVPAWLYRLASWRWLRRLLVKESKYRIVHVLETTLTMDGG